MEIQLSHTHNPETKLDGRTRVEQSRDEHKLEEPLKENGIKG